MKFIHLSDFHLGKRVNGFPMLEDQRAILTQIIGVVEAEQPQGVLIAGDVYDKPIPPVEAVELFDEFLVELARRRVQVFVISGNHDSPERLAFGGRLLDPAGIHLSPVYNGRVTPVTLEDEYGMVRVWLLPFVKPAHVRRFFPEAEIESYTDALRTAVEQMEMDPSQRNVLVTHQFVTGAAVSESEELSVGGTDNVDASVFDGFDYVALGHIHGPQNIGSQGLRYCGTPLKYSFSEARHIKSVTVAELEEKGKLTVRTIPLAPVHDMAELRGTYDELTAKAFYEHTTYREDYVHITLTDEEDIVDAIGKLRVIYRNLMKLDYDNQRTRSSAEVGAVENLEAKSPLELFGEFYEKQNGSPLSQEQESFLRELIEQAWEDEK